LIDKRAEPRAEQERRYEPRIPAHRMDYRRERMRSMY
jgi:hypothetical protein